MLRVVDDSTRTGARLATELIELRAQIDGLELRFSELAAQFDETGYWDLDGFNSALDWIRFNCRMTSVAAADRIAVGERSGELQESKHAMDAGQIGYAHLAVMARTANAIRAGFNESELLELAKDHTPGKFHYKCLHYRHAADAKAYALEQAEMVENRRLKLSTA